MPTTRHILGQTDDNVYKFMEEALASIDRTDIPLGDWVGLAMKTGETNIRAMELLDAGNTGTYGHPVPTKVPLGAKKGKAILISGHDLKDLEALLKQTEGKGHQRLHPRRDASHPRLSGAEEVSSLLRTLRYGMAEPAEGVCRLPRAPSS